MDLDKALQFVENYARGYLSYLLAFFGKPPKSEDGAEATDPFRTVLIFGIISAFLGAVFSFHATSGHFPTSDDITKRISIDFAYWVALATLLFLLLRAMRSPIGAMDVLLVVLSVMPVGYALGGYAAYLLSMISAVSTTARGAAIWGRVVFALVQLVVAAVYFPVYLSRLKDVGRVRTVIGSVVLVLAVAAVNLVEISSDALAR